MVIHQGLAGLAGNDSLKPVTIPGNGSLNDSVDRLLTVPLTVPGTIIE